MASVKELKETIKEQTKLAQNENYPKITSKGKAMF